jgi:predicted transcriptional regulator
MFKDYIGNMLIKLDKQNVLHLWEDGQGCTAQEIADELGMSVKWVESVICEYESKQLRNYGDFAEIK